MKTVLVTGSEGNIGCYVIAALRQLRPTWKIVRIKNGSGPAHFDPGNGYYVGDLKEADVLDLVFREESINYVIHAASTSYSHAGYKASPFTVLCSDCLITLNVLRRAAQVEKIVFLSSALIYESADVSLLEEELTDLIRAPTSSYGVAKFLGEQAVIKACLQYGSRYTIWRPFNVVSPLEPTEGEGRHVFVDFFRRLFVDGVSEFAVLGSGRQVRCFIWVEEAAECIVNAIDRPETDNQVINLARDEPITLIELKQLLVGIGREMGALPENYDPPVHPSGSFSGVEMEVRVPSTGKLQRLTGWRSSVSVADCFRKFVRAKLQRPESAVPGHLPGSRR